MTTIFRDSRHGSRSTIVRPPLAAQRPEVRSAVRSFLEETIATLEKFPPNAQNCFAMRQKSIGLWTGLPK